MRLRVVLVLLLAGCYRTHFVTSAQPATPPPPSIWHHSLIYGFLEVSPTDLDRVCPGGFAKVDQEITPVDGLLRTFIGGALWQPSTIQVWCSAGLPAGPPLVLPPPPSGGAPPPLAVPPPPLPASPPGAIATPPPPLVLPPQLTTPPVVH